MATANESDNAKVGDECSICLIPLSQPGLDIYTTACHHQFHFQCLAKNVQAQNNECPLCRTRLDSLFNILNPPTNTTPPVPTENVPVQQVPAVDVITQQVVAPGPELTQQVPPLETLQTQQAAPIETTSTVGSTGVWNTLTKSFRNAFGWARGASNTSTPSTTQKKTKSSWSVSRKYEAN